MGNNEVRLDATNHFKDKCTSIGSYNNDGVLTSQNEIK